jgi:hypothetical protein
VITTDMPTSGSSANCKTSCVLTTFVHGKKWVPKIGASSCEKHSGSGLGVWAEVDDVAVCCNSTCKWYSLAGLGQLLACSISWASCTDQCQPDYSCFPGHAPTPSPGSFTLTDMEKSCDAANGKN